MTIEHFKLLENLTSLSKDNSTKVSALLIDKYNSIISYGYNGLPRGMDDSNLEFQNKDKEKSIFYKYDLFEHAEQNCLYNFVKNNTNINQNGSFCVLSTIQSIDDIRALISIGIKCVYFNGYSNELTADNIKVIKFITSKSQSNIKLIRISNKGLKKSRVLNKVRQVYQVFANSIKNNTQFCVFFSADFGLISLGVEGFSDRINSVLGENKNTKNINSGDSELVSLDGFNLTIKRSDGEKVFNLKQSAIRNAIYNLINSKHKISDFKFIVSLQPCIHCSMAMISCGINLNKNLILQPISHNQNTSKRWGNEFTAIQYFANYLNTL